MRIITALILSVSLSLTAASADFETKNKKSDPEPANFKEAYAAYQSAQGKQKHLKTHYAQRAYELGLEKFGPEHNNTFNLAINWLKAFNNHTLGHDSPESSLKKTIDFFDRSDTQDPEGLIEFYIAYGSSILRSSKTRQPRRAMKYYRSAIKIAEKNFPDNDVVIATVNLEVGKSLYSSHVTKEARRYLDVAKKLYELKPEENAINLAISNFWRAKSYLTAKKYNNAAQSMSSALATFDQAAPASHYALTGHAFMVQILEEQGLTDEATIHCQKIGKAQPINVNREQLPLYKFSPKYPRSAASMGREGEVIVVFTVDEHGFVQDPRAVDGKNNSSFASSAIKAVKDYRFAPRFENGEPVSTDGLKYRFLYRMGR